MYEKVGKLFHHIFNLSKSSKVSKEYNLYMEWSDIESYRDFVIWIEKFFDDNKYNLHKLKKLNVYEFSGYYANMVSQFELKIFNEIIDKSESLKKQKSFLPIWQGAHRNKIKPKSDGLILTSNDFEIDLKKFKKFGKFDESIAKIRKDLISGRWNNYIHKYIKDNQHLHWFKDIRNYRHELIHQVDGYDNPFDDITKNRFKEVKTIIDVEKFLKISWELCNFGSKHSHINYFHYNYFIKNGPTLAFILLYNKYSENRITIATATNNNTSFTNIGIRENLILSDGTKVYRYIEKIRWNNSHYVNSIFSTLMAADFKALKHMGYEITTSTKTPEKYFGVKP